MSRRTSPIIFCASFLLLQADAARADTLLIEDTMTSPSSCTGVCPSRTVQGSGVFSTNGFQTIHREDRLIYDLGHEVSCGTLEISISNFQPYSQFRGNPVYQSQSIKFLGLFENPNGNHSIAINNNESIVALRYAPCLFWDSNLNDYVDCVPYMPQLRDDIFYNFGLQIGNCDPGCTCGADCESHGGHNCGLDDWIDRGVADAAPDIPGQNYVYRLDWDEVGVRFYIDGALRADESFPVYPNICHLQADVPRLRYLYVGRTEFVTFGHFNGPIWSDLRVWECDQCEGTAHCSNGVMDCDEEGVDCGGPTCAACNTPPRPAEIRVYSFGGERLDEGGPSTTRGSVVVLKASVDDTETPEALMRQCLFSVRTFGSADWNVLEDEPAVFVPGEPTLGWQLTWTVPENAAFGEYDVRFSYADEGDLSADAVENQEFSVTEEVVYPDAGSDDAGFDDAGENDDAGQGDAGPSHVSDRVSGGCNCRSSSSTHGGTGSALLFLIIVLLGAVTAFVRRR